jgi:hypothetical protein
MTGYDTLTQWMDQPMRASPAASARGGEPRGTATAIDLPAAQLHLVNLKE